ncbi:PRC-barrel domain-containing protein [Litoreibacter janthinus]|uniref:PRC-barrel domain-containing protein n=1 Tax=Litoreibacter janthinus TaxID=670154 RepID=A0A1I6GC29_9RHOB|nr:PRC-barrel domain-containing protein [Litoreibacter janthinus]SFR39742.1 PRC-barrel domain-containing protein [Litoreibacter janthinus]
MKHFLTSTAAALVLSTAAFADGHMAAFNALKFDESVNLNASELIGMRVYATEADINNDTPVAADGEKEWDDIGEINEIVLTRGGDVQAIIVGVGGFVGIGEKDVAIDMSQLKFVSDGEDADDYFLVVSASAAGVKEAPTYEGAMAGHSTDASMDRPMFTAPTMTREGYANVERDDLTTEDLTGARVYGPNDEDIGEVSMLLLTDDGKLDRAVIDVGGFLGLGERSVAVTLDELQIVRSAEEDTVRVYIDATQEALEQQPAYDG